MAAIPPEFPVSRPNTPDPSTADRIDYASISSAQAAIAAFPDPKLCPRRKRLISLPPPPSSQVWPEHWHYGGTSNLVPWMPRSEGSNLNFLQLLGLKKTTQLKELTEKRKEQRESNLFPRLVQLLEFAKSCEAKKADPTQAIRYLKRYTELCIREQKQRDGTFKIEQSQPVLETIQRALMGATVLLLDAEKDPTQHSRIFLSILALFVDQLDASILHDWKGEIIATFEEKVQKMHEKCAIHRLVALGNTCTQEKANRETLIQDLRGALEQYAIARGEKDSANNLSCSTVHDTVRTVILFLAENKKEEQERDAIFSQVMNACAEFLHLTTRSELYNETVLWDCAYNALEHLITTVLEGTANPNTIILDLSTKITRYVEVAQTIDPDFSVKADMTIFDCVQKTALFLCEKESDMKNQEKKINAVFEIYDKWLSAEEARYIRNKTKLLHCANALKALDKEKLLTPQQAREEQGLSRYGDILVQYFKLHAPSNEEFHEILQRYGEIEVSSDEESSEEKELNKILAAAQIDWDEKE